MKLKGFINIDARLTPATDKVMDISNLAEFSHNSVDMIYASHCLEHFGYRSVGDVLREWNRVLGKGGELILRVPDFDILVNTYLRRHPKPPETLNITADDGYLNKFLKVLRYLGSKKRSQDNLLRRVKTVIGLFFPTEKRTLSMNLLGDFLGGQDYPENQHKAFFNEKLLKALLSEAGFGQIKRVNVDYFPVDDASRHYATMGFSCLKQ